MPVPQPRPWQGRVFRHIPAGSPFGPLDTHFAGRSRENRWNLPGEPTLVFAGSRDLLQREFSAHLVRDRDPELAALIRPRQVFECDVALERLFDLTDPVVLDGFGIQQAPDCFADRAIARATAGFLRHVRGADGLLVPSMVARDDRSQRNLVVFLDRLGQPLEASVSVVKRLDTFGVDIPEMVVGDTNL